MTEPRGREKVGCKGEDAVREIMTHICADRPNARTNGVVVGSTGENAKFIAEDALNTDRVADDDDALRASKAPENWPISSSTSGGAYEI